EADHRRKCAGEEPVGPDEFDVRHLRTLAAGAPSPPRRRSPWGTRPPRTPSRRRPGLRHESRWRSPGGAGRRSSRSRRRTSRSVPSVPRCPGTRTRWHRVDECAAGFDELNRLADACTAVDGSAVERAQREEEIVIVVVCYPVLERPNEAANVAVVP